jgi:hypothetical protein
VINTTDTLSIIGAIPARCYIFWNFGVSKPLGEGEASSLCPGASTVRVFINVDSNLEFKMKSTQP